MKSARIPVTIFSSRVLRAPAAALLMLVLVTACENPQDPQRNPSAPAVASVRVSPDALHLALGSTEVLSATLLADNGQIVFGRPVLWASSDETVATVDRSGRLVPLREGTITVTATSGGQRGEARIMVIRPRAAAVLTAISPASIVAEGPNFTLTLSGSDFAPGAWVWVNGTPMISTFISGTELRVQVGSHHISQPGELPIKVLNLPPGGGQSAALPLSVLPHPDARPVPILFSVAPVSLVVGSGEQELSLFGDRFVAESLVWINGSQRPVTFVDDATLRVRLSADDVARTRDLYLQVRTPAPGGGGSGMITVPVRPAAVP